jgi:hypothetical protein
MSTNKVSHAIVFRVCLLLLTVPELSTPMNGKLNGHHMAGVHGGSRYTSHNPLEALEALPDDRSDGSGSLGSPTSSGGSISQRGYAGGVASLISPSRGQTRIECHQRVYRHLLSLCDRFANHSRRSQTIHLLSRCAACPSTRATCPPLHTPGVGSPTQQTTARAHRSR